MMGWNEFVPPHFSISGLVAQLGEQSPYITTIQFYIWACSSVGERSVRIREVVGSTPIRSTKQGSDEHLFLQRRFCRQGDALIRTETAILD